MTEGWSSDEAFSELLTTCKVYVVEQNGKMYLATSPYPDKARQGYTLAFLQMHPWWGVAQSDRRPSEIERKLAQQFCDAINLQRGHK